MNTKQKPFSIWFEKYSVAHLEENYFHFGFHFVSVKFIGCFIGPKIFPGPSLRSGPFYIFSCGFEKYSVTHLDEKRKKLDNKSEYKTKTIFILFWKIFEDKSDTKLWVVGMKIYWINLSDFFI